MPAAYQIKEQSGMYFLTLTVIDWLDVFTSKTCREILVESLKYCQSEKGLIIYAWVVMSNHVHLIVQSANSELSNTIHDFKRFTSRKIINEVESSFSSRKEWLLNRMELKAKSNKRNENYQFWIQDNHAELLISVPWIWEKINYIHNNPVKADIVFLPEEYKYSSAINYKGGKGLIDVRRYGLKIQD